MLLVPVRPVVILPVGQEGSDVDVAHRLFAVSLPGIMNHRDEPVAVMPDIEDHVSVYCIGVAKNPSHVRKTRPACRRDDFKPRRYLFGRVGIVSGGMAQVFARNDVHREIIFSF